MADTPDNAEAYELPLACEPVPPCVPCRDFDRLPVSAFAEVFEPAVEDDYDCEPDVAVLAANRIELGSSGLPGELLLLLSVLPASASGCMEGPRGCSTARIVAAELPGGSSGAFLYCMCTVLEAPWGLKEEGLPCDDDDDELSEAPVCSKLAADSDRVRDRALSIPRLAANEYADCPGCQPLGIRTQSVGAEAGSRGCKAACLADPA